LSVCGRTIYFSACGWENVQGGCDIFEADFDTQNDFMLVPEEQLTHLTNVSGGPEDDIRRADMVYFNVEGGGSVFSVGSITFCGCLPWNKFENNISRILLNVLSKQLGKEAL